VAEGDLIAVVKSQQLESQVNDLDRLLVEQSQKEADLRIRLRIASATREATRDRLAIASEAYQRLDGDRAGVTSLGYRMDVYRERSLANIALAQAEAEADETRRQLERLERNRAEVQGKIDATRAEFDEGRIKAPVDGLVGSLIANPGEVIRPGDSMLEIYDLSESYITWQIPAFSLRQPKVADVVYVYYGSKVMPGYVWDIQQLAQDAPEAGQSILRGRERRQVILVKLQRRGVELPIHAQVTIRMNYSGLAEAAFGWLFGEPA
jgi:multidrug resistance efflux pump